MGLGFNVDEIKDPATAQLQTLLQLGIAPQGCLQTLGTATKPRWRSCRPLDRRPDF
jgi:hypothetical protein